MLIVTGTGRSGTSVMARFLHEAGYDCGSTQWFPRVNAGYEYGPANDLNRAIAQDAERGTLVPDRYFETIRAVRLDVVKAPSFHFHREIARTWVAARDDLAFLVLLREIPQVIRSLEANPEHFWNWHGRPSLVYRKICELWLELTRLGVPFRSLAFPDFLHRWDSVAATLSELGLPVDSRRGLWASLVDPEKVHHR